MSENTLKKIIDNKTLKINNLKKTITIDSLAKKISENNTFINFKEKILNNYNKDKISIIAEIKKSLHKIGIFISLVLPGFTLDLIL